MKNTIIILLILSAIFILITGNWNYVSQNIFPNTTWGLYNKDFFENLLVEIHGGIIDLMIVGVILFWFDKKRNDRELKDKAKKELDYLRYYNGSDASYKFYGALKYLISLKEKTVSIPEGNLSNLKINDLELKASNLTAVNFSSSKLKNIKFYNCKLEACQFIDTEFKDINFDNINLKRSKFINAKLNGIDFSNCLIDNSNFKNAELRSAIFKNVDCSNVTFKGADLTSANFVGAKNLTREMILEAKKYKNIKGIDI